MIIKIQQNGGWLFIDGIESVSCYNIPDGSSDEKLSEENYDLVYYGHSPNVGRPTSVLVRARREDGKEVGISCDLDCYLLNDSGKTIERLN
jgi:hypothetical protein